MKMHDYFWEIPALDTFRKQAHGGDFLFQQGFPANSLIIIVRGMVELVAKKDNQLCSVNYLGAGNVLGEQALVDEKVYARVFGARALGEVSYVELTKANIDELRKNSPKLLIDILEATLRISTERLNRMNRLLAQLRSANPTERFLYLLLHFAAHHGQTVEEGKEVVLNFDTVNFYLDISSYQMEEILADLCARKTLHKKADNVYVIKNEKSLLDQIPKLKEEINPLSFI